MSGILCYYYENVMAHLIKRLHCCFRVLSKRQCCLKLKGHIKVLKCGGGCGGRSHLSSLLVMSLLLLFILSVIRHLICRNNLNWLLKLNLFYETLWTGVRSGLLIWMLGKLEWFHLIGQITMVVLTWKWMSLFLRKQEKLSFKMLLLTFSSKLDWVISC